MTEIGDVKQDIERAKTLQQAAWAALERAEMHLAAAHEDAPIPEPKECELWVTKDGYLRVWGGGAWRWLNGAASMWPGIRRATREDVRAYWNAHLDSQAVVSEFLCNHFGITQ